MNCSRRKLFPALHVHIGGWNLTSEQISSDAPRYLFQVFPERPLALGWRLRILSLALLFTDHLFAFFRDLL